MKVLWVSGRLIGPAASIINSDYKGTSGGWIQTEFEDLDKSGIDMYYLAGVKSLHSVEKKENVYCVQLPRISSGIKAPSKLIKDVERVIAEISPDIIHIWGTETCLQDAVSQVTRGIPKVVFIQGLIGMHDRYRGGYIDRTDKSYIRSISLRKRMEQMIRKVTFKRQIEIEQNILKTCKNVILDNDFSRAYCYSISDDIRFFGRRLNANDCFYKKTWNLKNVTKHTIFTVYAGTPDKGLHQLLKALKLVKKSYPDVVLKIPGPFKLGTKGEIICKNTSSYEKWVSKFIADNALSPNVEFIGSKSQQEMAEEISRSHLFVNPSCMEVHALSLREAMTVGAPCISSLCGSVSEYLQSGVNGILYRYEEYEVLAYNILKLFNNDCVAIKMGESAKTSMTSSTEDSKSIPLNRIYKNIVEYYEDIK